MTTANYVLSTFVVHTTTGCTYTGFYPDAPSLNLAALDRAILDNMGTPHCYQRIPLQTQLPPLDDTPRTVINVYQKYPSRRNYRGCTLIYWNSPSAKVKCFGKDSQVIT